LIKYGSDEITELQFAQIHSMVETRGQWIDVYLKLEPSSGSAGLDDIADLGALVICNAFGEIIQFVVLEEGCDSEYQFTEGEKEQISRYVKELNVIERVKDAEEQ
jgi:hypothetical protein